MKHSWPLNNSRGTGAPTPRQLKINFVGGPPYLGFSTCESSNHALCSIVVFSTEKKNTCNGFMQFKYMLSKGQLHSCIIDIPEVENRACGETIVKEIKKISYLKHCLLIKSCPEY